MSVQQTPLLLDLVRSVALARTRRFTARRVAGVCGADRVTVTAYLDGLVRAGELSRVVVASLPVYSPRNP